MACTGCGVLNEAAAAPILIIWHSVCSFFNLELADTNVVDHNTHVWDDETFEVRERSDKKVRWWTETLRER